MPIAKPNDTQGMTSAVEAKRSLGEDAVPAPTHSRNSVPADYKSIDGWGADLDPANRPAYPKELPSNVKTVRGDVRDKQVPKHRIHMSNEHPDLAPAFGTSCPPRGLSGLLRDYAYEFGEATNRHWLTLVLADRVDMVEHLISDALMGKPDRWIKEKAWGTRLSHASADQKKNYMLVGAVAMAAIGFGIAFSAQSKRRR